MDGLAKCAANRDQAAKKPGHAVILLLLLLNVGVWLLMVFEPKMTSAFVEIPVRICLFHPPKHGIIEIFHNILRIL